jgi:hypothetical protein
MTDSPKARISLRGGAGSIGTALAEGMGDEASAAADPPAPGRESPRSGGAAFAGVAVEAARSGGPAGSAGRADDAEAPSAGVLGEVAGSTTSRSIEAVRIPSGGAGGVALARIGFVS